MSPDATPPASSDPAAAGAAAPPGRIGFGQVLRNRQFFALWLAQLISSFGDWIAILALFSLVAFRWQGTPYQVSGILLAYIGPMAILGPIAGVYVDRWRLKRTMVGSDLVRAVFILGLVFADQLWQVYALTALLSAGGVFFLPAQSATIPLLVRREELLIANSINAQTVQLNKIVGPAVAGLLVAGVGERACFLLDAVTFVASAALLARIRVERPARAQVERGVRAVLRDLRRGVEFLWQHRALRFVVTASIAAIFAIGAFDALAAVYVRDILGAESRMFGSVVALVGAGTIAGAFAIGRFGQQTPRVLLVVLGILGLGLGVGMLAATGSVAVALGSALWLGLAAGGVMVPAQTLTQEETPHEILGRVSSTSLALITVAQLVAIGAAGKIADWIGVRNLYYGVALALILIAGSGYAYARAHGLIRRLPAASVASP